MTHHTKDLNELIKLALKNKANAIARLIQDTDRNVCATPKSKEVARVYLTRVSRVICLYDRVTPDENSNLRQ